MSEKKSGAGSDEQEFSLISKETLLALYRGLLRERAVWAANGSRRGRKGGWAYDATAVAVAQDLIGEDAVIADGPAGLLRIMPVNRRNRSVASSVFAHELERAVGGALAQKTKKNGRVTVVFGGAAQDEAWHDAVEIARAHRLPMIFVAEVREENVPGRRGPRKSKGAELEPGTEMARIIVDGHDVVGSYRVAHEAVERARKGRGPTVMECAEFRIPGQRRQDAVAAMEQYLRGKGLLERTVRGSKRPWQQIPCDRK